MLTRTSAARPPRAPAAVVALAALAAFAGLVRRVWPFTVDDTYITLRYARHLASGLGLTFNPGAVHAEGYTSLAWTVLLALPHRLGLDAVLAAKALGVLATLATAFVAGRWAHAEARADGGHRLAAIAAPALFLTLPATAVHAVSGMETAIATLLLVAVLAAAGAAVREAGTRAVRALPPLAALLAFTRPEGVLAGGLAILCVLWLRPHDRARQLGWAALAFALPLALGEAARLAYYHLPLPLPYYVKLAHPGMFAGAGVVGRWLGDHAWRLGPFVLVAALRPPRSLWPALAVTAALAAFFTLPQHLMGYQHRYVAPCDPTLCVLAAVGLDRLVRAAARRRWPGQIVTWAAPALVLLAGALELTDARLDVPERLAYARGMASAHLPVAHALAALGGHGRIVLSDAGSIPYYTDWWTYDLVGLNEPSVALTHRREPAQILAPAPDAIVLVSLHADRFAPWDWNAYEAPLLTAALRAGYAHVATRRFGDDYWLWLLAKPGTRVARALAAAR